MSKEQKQPYVRFFASDWLGGTRGMKAAEVGIYITLIAMMYERCEPLPEDHKKLSRQCGCGSAAFAKALEMLVDDGKVTRLDEGLWNNRVEKEFKWREKNSQQSSDAANERWKKSNKNKGDDMQAQSERNADGMPKPEARSQKPESIVTTPPASPLPSSLPDDLHRLLVEAAGACLSRTSPQIEMVSDALGWLGDGCDLALDILPTLKANGKRKPANSVRSWSFFADAVREARDRRNGKGQSKQQPRPAIDVDGLRLRYGGAA